MLAHDRLLDNRYQIVERIGSGGMGAVWKAYDRQAEMIVAVKMLRLELVGDANWVRRFGLEAQAARRVVHPNVVRVLGSGHDGPVHYIVMEFVPGDNLVDHVRSFGQRTTQWSLRVLAEIADALQASHDQRVVHRDVKPQNIMIGGDGTAKLTDFGIALAPDRDWQNLTAPGFLVGTGSYMAPEQMLGGKAGPAVDIYALGVVGYWLFCDRLPFDPAADKIREAPPPMPAHVPADIREVIGTALQFDPTRRQESAGELAAAFRRCGAPDPGQARPAPAPAPAPQPPAPAPESADLTLEPAAPTSDPAAPTLEPAAPPEPTKTMPVLEPTAVAGHHVPGLATVLRDTRDEYSVHGPLLRIGHRLSGWDAAATRLGVLLTVAAAAAGLVTGLLVYTVGFVLVGQLFNG